MECDWSDFATLTSGRSERARQQRLLSTPNPTVISRGHPTMFCKVSKKIKFKNVKIRKCNVFPVQIFKLFKSINTGIYSPFLMIIRAYI